MLDLEVGSANPTLAPESADTAGGAPAPAAPSPPDWDAGPSATPKADDPTPVGGDARPGDGADDQPSPLPKAGDTDDQSPPPWAEVRSVSELLAHESVQEELTTLKKTEYDNAYSAVQRRLQPFLQREAKAMESINTGVQKLVTGWQKAVKADLLDAESIDDMLIEHRESLSALAGLQQEQGRWNGARGILYLIAQAGEATELYRDYDTRIVDAAAPGGESVADIVSDFYTTLTKDAVAKALATREKQITKEVTERVEREVRARHRIEGGPPPPKPVGSTTSSGGASGLTLEKYKALKPAEQHKLQKEHPEVIDALWRELFNR